MRYCLTAADYFFRRGPVMKHNPDKAPAECRFCRHGCNRYNYYTWHNRETKRYAMRPMAICFLCAAHLEIWAKRIGDVVADPDELEQMEIMPQPCELMRELMAKDAEMPVTRTALPKAEAREPKGEQAEPVAAAATKPDNLEFN